MSATDLLTNGTRVTLTHTLDPHTAGSTGTIHGSWASHTGVIFDSNPDYIRYVPPSYLTTHNDVADVTKAAEDAVLHIIESAWGMDTPCSWPEGCDIAAVWWYEHDCGTTIYSCEKHRIIQDDHNVRRLRNGKRSICRGCDNNTPNPIPWRAL
jgi:hypothetical protein